MEAQIKSSAWRYWFSAGLLCFAMSVTAMDRGRQVLITNPAHQQELMSLVENAIWASDGSAADKQVYVIYSTQCGWSKKLFNDTRELGDKLQLRWIPAAAAGADQVVSVRDGTTVAAAFDGSQGTPADPQAGQRGVNYNYAVMNSTSRLLKEYGGGSSFSFPTLIYRTDKGVQVISGNPADLKPLAEQVVSQPDKAVLMPAGLALTANAVSTKPASKFKQYTNNEEQAVKVYALPDTAAPVLDLLPSGYQLPVSGIVSEQPWAEVLPWGNRGPKAYIYAPLEIKLAALEYQVKRASGNITASRDLQVRSHPDVQAPVLTVLEKGYQLTKSGEVELNGKTWDEVVVFTDGTKGYISR